MLSDFDLCFRSNTSPRLETRTRAITTRNNNYASCLGSSNRQIQERVTEFVAEPTEAFSPSCVGTHEHLSPEVVNGDGHGNGVDWWAFGVLIYELLCGTTPFKGADKESTLCGKRLGCMRGAADIKSHPFFHGVKWPLMRMCKVPEVRGLQVKRSYSGVKGKAHVSGHVTPRRNRCFWKKLSNYMTNRINGSSSKYTLSSNYNFYKSYVAAK